MSTTDVLARQTALLNKETHPLRPLDLEHCIKAISVSDAMQADFSHIKVSDLDEIVRIVLSWVDQAPRVESVSEKSVTITMRGKPTKRRARGEGSYTKGGGWVVRAPSHPLASSTGRVQKWRLLVYKDGDLSVNCSMPACNHSMSWFAESRIDMPYPHYIDGNNYNCTPENLRVLCHDCKSQQPKNMNTVRAIAMHVATSPKP